MSNRGEKYYKRMIKYKTMENWEKMEKMIRPTQEFK